MRITESATLFTFFTPLMLTHTAVDYLFHLLSLIFFGGQSIKSNKRLVFRLIEIWVVILCFFNVIYEFSFNSLNGTLRVLSVFNIFIEAVAFNLFIS